GAEGEGQGRPDGGQSGQDEAVLAAGAVGGEGGGAQGEGVVGEGARVDERLHEAGLRGGERAQVVRGEGGEGQRFGAHPVARYRTPAVVADPPFAVGAALHLVGEGALGVAAGTERPRGGDAVAQAGGRDPGGA